MANERKLTYEHVVEPGPHLQGIRIVGSDHLAVSEHV